MEWKNSQGKKNNYRLVTRRLLVLVCVCSVVGSRARDNEDRGEDWQEEWTRVLCVSRKAEGGTSDDEGENGGCLSYKLNKKIADGRSMRCNGKREGK